MYPYALCVSSVALVQIERAEAAWMSVAAVLNGNDVVPTSGGKSLYVLPSPSTWVLVISPLISLMKNQVP